MGRPRCHAQAVLTFDDLAVATEVVCEAAKEHVLTVGPPWAGRSEAATDTRQERRYRDTWGANPQQDAIMRALMSLGHGVDHLIGMSYLFNAPEVAHGPVTLSRTVVSASSRAYWLLAPGIGARERLRRGMNVRLESLAEQLRVVHGVERWAASADKLRDQVAAITSSATRHDFDVQFGRKVAGVVQHYLDPKMPSEMELAGLLPIAGNGFDPALTHYRLASASVHAQPHSIGLVTLERAGRTIDGVTPMQSIVSLANTAVWCGPAVVSFYVACTQALQIVGGPLSEFRADAAPGMITWRAALREAAPARVHLCDVQLPP